MCRTLNDLTKCLQALILLSTFFSSEQVNQGDHLPLKTYQQLDLSTFEFNTQARIKKRETIIDKPYLSSNRLKFTAFNRDFNILLKRDNQLIGNNINIELRYSSKPSEYLNDFLTSNYYTGIVEDEHDSQVILYFENDNSSFTLNNQPLIFAQIRIKSGKTDTIYYIEPIIKPDHQNTDQKYLIYRSEDVQSDIFSNQKFNTTICRAKYAGNITSLPNESSTNETKKKRSTENEARKNRCPLALVADHRFYREIGNSNEKLTAAYMMNIIASVNNIFTRTVWNFDNIEDERLKTNFGFSIEKIIVHKEPTINVYDHYNNPNSSKNAEIILELFGEEDWSSYCLAHLFTFETFDNSVLGLAYVSSPLIFAIGGICSASGRSRRVSHSSVNTGLSSYKSFSQQQGRLLQKEAELVTAHELGHNWGSEHDPLTADCTPGSSNGGNFLMYPYANQGNEINNFRPCQEHNEIVASISKATYFYKIFPIHLLLFMFLSLFISLCLVFSRCSINGISEVLKVKTACFRGESLTFCGNDRIEEGEECDAGLKGRQGIDPCCDYNCKLKSNAQCSDNNHYCCLNCRIAPENFTCYSSSNYLECFQDYSLCDGRNRDCPSPKVKPKNTPCNSYDQGKCNDRGRCNSLCKQMDESFDQCKCSTQSEKCMVCCKDLFEPNSQCRPIHEIFPRISLTYLSEGRSCYNGICEKNVCKPKVKDHVTRFWKIIQKASISSFVEFARRNIVAAVIVISLSIWIPISCCIHFCKDKRIKSEYHKIVRMERYKSRQLKIDDIDNVED